MSRYWIYLGMGEGDIRMIANIYDTWKVYLKNDSEILLSDVTLSGEVYSNNTWTIYFTKKCDLDAIKIAYKNVELVELEDTLITVPKHSYVTINN